MHIAWFMLLLGVAMSSEEPEIDFSALTLEQKAGVSQKTQDSCKEASKNSMQLMRSRLQKVDLPFKEIDDEMLERFLVTNAMDEKKASDALLRFLKWRSTFTPLGNIPEDKIVIERKKGKICLQGHDKMGRTIGVFLVVRHDAFDRDLEEFKCYAVYTLDKAIASTNHKLKQVSVIVDLAGWSYRSVDVRGYLALLEILQEHYLNHLGKMILVHVPLIFWAAWKVTSPFFNEFTRERMIFVEDKNLKSILLDEIDEDQLPDIYGGKLPLDPV